MEGEKSRPRIEAAHGDPSEEEDRHELAEDRTEWAEKRTWWANVRTLLAKERTLSAWMRTGLATLVSGLAVLEFLAGGDAAGRPVWATALGIVLTGASAAIFVIGFWSYRQTIKELEAEGVRGVPTWILGGITAVLVGAAGIGLILLL